MYIYMPILPTRAHRARPRVNPMPMLIMPLGLRASGAALRGRARGAAVLRFAPPTAECGRIGTYICAIRNMPPHPVEYA